MALIRSLSRGTIRVGSYCPEILSTCASKNAYDFHRSIGGINDNPKTEFENARPSTNSYTSCARNFHRTTTNRIDVGIEDIDQEEVPEKGKILTVAFTQYSKKYLRMNRKASTIKISILKHRYLFTFRCRRVVRRCRLQSNGGRAVHLASRRPQPYVDSARWIC